jgi:uncharacterized repeat protein (TIGR01451 family)
MLKLLSTTLILLFSYTALSQIVNIPDTDFKEYLVNYPFYTIDTNNDDEIQVAEAAAIGGNAQLIISDNLNITDLTGLGAFINIERLYIDNQTITEIDLTSLISLDQLFVNNEFVETILFPNPTNLRRISLSCENLASIDVFNQVNVEDFFFGGTGDGGITILSSLVLPNSQTLNNLALDNTLLDEIDISNYVNLEYVRLIAGNFSELDISQNNSINDLHIEGTSISEVNVTNLNALETLEISISDISNIDLSNNSILRSLDLTNTNIASLDLTNNPLLINVDLADSDLTNVDYPISNDIRFLRLNGNLFENIDLSQNISVEFLRINNLYINEIDLSVMPLLSSLQCSNSSLTTIDMSQNINLEQVYMYNSLFQNLDFSNSPNIFSINTNNSDYLESINIKNISLPDLSLNANNNPNLNFICVDDITEAIAQDFDIPSQTTYIDDCSIAELNKLIGLVTFDVNNDDCTTDAIPIINYIVNATNGTSNFANSTNGSGNYSINLFNETYTTQVLGLSPYFDTNPITASNTFDSFNETQTANFCVQPNTVANDLTISILPINQARPGFEANYEIIFENVGTTTLDAEVTLDFSKTQVDFMSATPAPTSQTVSSITFNVGSLSPFEQGSILATFLLEEPPVNESGDVLPYTATISPETDDATPEDNVFFFPQIIVNSFDPNDKTCVQGEEVFIDNANDYLHYIIRFQNLGTASAINVRVEDFLDDLLDFSTFRVLSSSNEMEMETIIVNNNVTFNFQNIMLPAEIDDPEGSNGYITFKIKPLPGIVIGDEIRNRAVIYFDFNPAIITNLTSTTYVEELGLTKNEFINLTLYPNPTNGIINIATEALIEEIKIYNTIGQEMKFIQLSENKNKVDISTLVDGLYFIKTKTSIGKKVHQVLKK